MKQILDILAWGILYAAGAAVMARAIQLLIQSDTVDGFIPPVDRQTQPPQEPG